MPLSGIRAQVTNSCNVIGERIQPTEHPSSGKGGLLQRPQDPYLGRGGAHPTVDAAREPRPCEITALDESISAAMATMDGTLERIGSEGVGRARG